MSTHTPGPFEISVGARSKKRPSSIREASSHGNLVYIAMRPYTTGKSFSPEQQWANAYLFAASPELLEALERTLANFKRVLARQPVRDATETIAEAEAAIARAKGQK